jgi:3-oxoacyl-[acyl-carrier-protein] synthase II
MISPASATPTRARALLALTSWSIHLPGLDITAALSEAAGSADSEPACSAEQASTILGRKGLLYKEPATRLALCAVHRALGLAPGQRPDPELRTDTAVVACSNLGNVQTVAEIARTVATEGGRAVSPMAAPNASSNVIASTVALWFHFGGPNLMVCSGATAGLDAIALGALLIGSGRADRVVVVGAEPDDTTAGTLHGYGNPAAPLRSGAACVILERAAGESSGTAPRLHVLGHGDRWPRPPARVIGPGAGLDPAAIWGDCYGAQGVVQLAFAAHLAADRGWAVGVTCGSEPDGWRSAMVEPAGQAAIPTQRSGAVDVAAVDVDVDVVPTRHRQVVS